MILTAPRPFQLSMLLGKTSSTWHQNLQFLGTLISFAVTMIETFIYLVICAHC